MSNNKRKPSRTSTKGGSPEDYKNVQISAPLSRKSKSGSKSAKK